MEEQYFNENYNSIMNVAE